MKHLHPHSLSIQNLYTPNKGRRDALSGIWSALVWPQGVTGVPDEIPVRFKFNATGKIITGEMSFKSWDKRRDVIDNYFVGGFEDDSRLTFWYTKKLDRILGWGALVFELSPDGQKIDGHIVGVSSHTGQHFYSKAVLRKGAKADLRAHSILKRAKPTIFIGHGRAAVWKQLKQYLQKAGYRVETFESGPRAGKTTHDVLTSMMTGTSFALLVLTGEDKTKLGTMRARQNVVHETGLFQGKLGINRAIILLERGVEEFSNASGITYIPFRKNKISDTFKPIIATLRREFPTVK
jgi:hypothetical protein